MAQDLPYEVLIEDSAKQRQEWLEARRLGIGASEAAGVLGASRWSTPFKVFQAKTGALEIVPQTEAQKWGHKLQDLVGQEIADELGGRWERDERLLRSKKYPWMLATPDGRLILVDGTRTPGEIKTTGDKDAWDDGIPRETFIQCQQQMVVLEARMVIVGVFFRMEALSYWARCHRDDEFIDTVLVPGTQRAWEGIQKGVLPPVDGHEETKAAIKARWPTHVPGKTHLAPGSLEVTHDELQMVKEQIKAMETKERHLENILKVEAGDAETMVLGASGITYSYRSFPVKESVHPAHTKRVLRWSKGK
jgi:putative phage-type endonuclease